MKLLGNMLFIFLLIEKCKFDINQFACMQKIGSDSMVSFPLQPQNLFYTGKIKPQMKEYLIPYT